MKKSIQLRIEQSEVHEKLRTLNAVAPDELTDEQRGEMATLSTRAQQLEPELRAALVAEDAEQRTEATDDAGLTTEQRDRLELRGRASLTEYIRAVDRGRGIVGAERELQQAARVPDNGVPFELWHTRPVLEREARAAARPAGGEEHRAITPAAATVGVNMDLVRPFVFAPSIADRLLIEMPMVGSGDYATSTITTAVTAGAAAKEADVPATAGTLTAQSTSPHRIGATLELAWEDIARVGAANFEAALRDHVSMVLSDELDDQLINGDGSANTLTGIMARLTATPLGDASAVATWANFVASQAAAIDGLWAMTLMDIAMVVNPETYRLAASVFQGADAEESAAAYLARQGTFWTNSRMPGKSNTGISTGIVCRKGRPGLRTAVAPTWGYMSIDDVYTRSPAAVRRYTVSVLIGDVLLVQRGAYAEVAHKVS